MLALEKFGATFFCRERNNYTIAISQKGRRYYSSTWFDANTQGCREETKSLAIKNSVSRTIFLKSNTLSEGSVYCGNSLQGIALEMINDRNK